jgi:hypothetical protein
MGARTGFGSGDREAPRDRAGDHGPALGNAGREPAGSVLWGISVERSQMPVRPETLLPATDVREHRFGRLPVEHELRGGAWRRQNRRW